MTKWRDTTLGDIAEIVSGATPKTSVEQYWGGGLPWVTPTDLSRLEGAYIGSTTRTLTKAGFKNCASSLLPANSVLLSSRAPIGLVAINTIPMATNQGLKSLVPDHSQVNSKFLYWWLRCHRVQLEAIGNGATFKEVSKKVVASVPISIPPLEEQRRIAALLDSAEALRAKRRQALAKLESLTQAIFNYMFMSPESASHWPIATLKDICQSKGEYGANVPSQEFDGSRPRYLRITDIQDDGNLIQDAVSPGRQETEWFSKSLHSGDIVFARSGTVGKTFLVREETEPLVFAGYLIRFIPDQQRVVPEYLYQFTRTKKYHIWVSKTATTVAQPNINAKRYGQLEVPLPPLKDQLRFSNIVREIREHSETLTTQASLLDTLFASLQQRAFRGEL